MANGTTQSIRVPISQLATFIYFRHLGIGEYYYFGG